MASIIPFPGNFRRAPQEERLTVHEAPIRKGIIDEVDVSVASLYPYAVRSHEALSRQTAPSGQVISQVDALLLQAQQLRQERGYDAQKAA
jgi:hypothetical protein